MARLTLALAFLALACTGPMTVDPFGERSTARLQFEDGATEAVGQLLAFDPKSHSLDILIELPLEQPDNVEVFLIPPSGIRYQVLGSFQNCEVDGSARRCPRRLPALPTETADAWRVEALRTEPSGATSIEVSVSWKSARN
ncbi:MAG: hypothetical protein FWJ92_08015 [Actinomycetes bacterium]|jgi:hypothetical protein|nr:hypothetical protein [Acidimicrobiia bacterium]